MISRNAAYRLASRWVDSSPFWRVVLWGSSLAGLIRRKDPKWAVLEGYAAETLGKVDRAAGAWVRAEALAKGATVMAVMRWLQPVQFFLERLYHRRGTPRQVDPLFLCSAVPVKQPSGKAAGGAGAAGRYKVEFTFDGLMIMGIVPEGRGRNVGVYINGELLREFSLGGGKPFSRFKITILRSTMAHFPSSGLLTLEMNKEGALAPFGSGGYNACWMTVPHGSGALLSSAGDRVRLDKKGNIVGTPEYRENRKKQYLSLYEQANAFFERTMGRSLILLYGTLLGVYRNGDLIEGDDDFDTGYVSEAADPEALKKEMLGVMRSLIEEGFTVSFNRSGRLFRLHAPFGQEADYEQSLHLDITPVWFQDGYAWSHNHFWMSGSPEDFLPEGSRILGGTKVYIPADSEKFLVRQYGPGWKVPDPGFVYHRDEMDNKMLANLTRAFITPAEYRELLKDVEERRKDNPSLGRLVSLGAEDFYPLRGLEDDIE